VERGEWRGASHAMAQPQAVNGQRPEPPRAAEGGRCGSDGEKHMSKQAVCK
jgi:hypothetical protein